MRTCDENIKKSASKSGSEGLNLNAASGLNLAPQAVLKSVQSAAGEQIYFSDFSAIDWRTVQVAVFRANKKALKIVRDIDFTAIDALVGLESQKSALTKYGRLPAWLQRQPRAVVGRERLRQIKPCKGGFFQIYPARP